MKIKQKNRGRAKIENPKIKLSLLKDIYTIILGILRAFYKFELEKVHKC